jgi:hypothetical protein
MDFYSTNFWGTKMKTNLDNLFKTDSSMEKDGIWFDIGNGVRFQLRRFGGSNAQKVKAAMTKHSKPFARLIELDQLPVEKDTEIMAKTFIEACLVSWEGVKVDDVEVPCTPENALKLFTSLPELFQTLLKYSQGFDSFKEELGNS